MANYLTQKTGVLVNLVPERNARDFARRIVEERYGVIVTEAAQVGDAMRAGYVPVAANPATTAPAFVVKADAKFKTLDEVRDAKVAFSTRLPVTVAAMSEMGRRKLDESNEFNDVGVGARAALLDAVRSGKADVVAMNYEEAEAAVSASDGKLRVLGKGAGISSHIVWVRSDLAGGDFGMRFAAAWLSASADSSDAAGKAAGLAMGASLGTNGILKPATPDVLKALDDALKIGATHFPDSYFAVKANKEERAANLKLSVLEPVIRSVEDPVFVARDRLAAQLRQQTFVGITPSVSLPNDHTSFVRSLLPLANFLSEKSSVLVNLLPERGTDDFARRIGEARYGVIVTEAAQVGNAIKAGYVPLVMTKAEATPAFVVKAEAKFKTLDEVRDAKVAFSTRLPVTVSALNEMGRRKLDESNQFNDVGLGGRNALLEAVRSGRADVVAVNADDAETVIAASGGKLRLLAKGAAIPSHIVLIRKDLAGSDFAIRVATGFTEATQESAGAVQAATRSALGTAAPMVVADEGAVTALAAALSVAQARFPDFFRQVAVDARVREANLSASAIVKR